MKKTNVIRKVLGLLFILMLVVDYSCDGSSDSDDTHFSDVPIIRELPKLTIIGNHLDSVIINSEDELEAIFNDTELHREESLRDIDFSKYSLLLGYGTYGNEVSSIEHHFTEIAGGNYLYLIKISGLATRPDAFRYGIIVPKLPKTVRVDFEIEKI